MENFQIQICRKSLKVFKLKLELEKAITPEP